MRNHLTSVSKQSYYQYSSQSRQYQTSFFLIFDFIKYTIIISKKKKKKRKRVLFTNSTGIISALPPISHNFLSRNSFRKRIQWSYQLDSSSFSFNYIFFIHSNIMTNKNILKTPSDHSYFKTL